MKLKIKPRPSSYFHLHAHSHYSTLDAIETVEEMVAQVVRWGQPALALTDHGNMSGVFSLYKLCRKNGLLPFPGFEAYLVSDVKDKNAKRYHVTFSAFTTEGYQLLVKLCSMSHERENYHYKPRIDFAMIEAMNGMPGVFATSGCWFGWPSQALDEYGFTEAGFASLNRRLRKMASLFKHFHIEVQHHAQPNDNDLVRLLAEQAHKLGLPIVATQDAHYCDLADAPLHTMMKQLAYGGDPGDSGFPGDSYHLASTEWVRGHYEDPYLGNVWSEAESAYTDLLNTYSLKLPFLDKYQFHVPEMAANPDAKLRVMCTQAMRKLGKDNDKYKARLEYELATIKVTNFANYFLLTGKLCQWMRSQSIFFNARGSANNSLACWLMDITEVDPVLWKLNFDRFLTPDRVKPPDVDLDIEHTRRDEVVDYAKREYEVVQISSYSRLGYDEYGQGSIFRTFMASSRRRVDDAEWEAKYKGLNGIGDVARVFGQQFADDLMALGDKVIYKSHGSHAAGFAIGTKALPIEGWMPTMLVASSGTRVTQPTMDDVEGAGYVKEDLLGSKTLTTMNMCLSMLGKPDWHWIPLRDPATFSMLRKGRTDTGVFQLEGWTASKGCREIGVKTVADIILVNALYRPAARDGGYTAQFLKNRASRTAYYPHPIFEKHLAETWGVAAFQEQVLDILRDLGMGAAEMNQFLTALKVKHGGAEGARIMVAQKAKYAAVCKKVGMSVDEIDYSWGMVEGFAAYGFNKGHATAYSLLSYRTAYLKVHHPLEYHTALLATWAGSGDKEKVYAQEARRVGIPILAPHVNVSGFTWSLDKKRGAIRRGLLSIKGVGVAAAQEIEANAPYRDVHDLIARTNARMVTGGKSYAKDGTLTGVLKALDAHRALAELK